MRRIIHLLPFVLALGGLPAQENGISFAALVAGERMPITGNSAILLPATPAGVALAFAVEARNPTGQPAQMPDLRIEGPGFALALPTGAAPVLAPGEVLVYPASLMPQATGALFGRLLIGGRAFPIQSTGLVPPRLSAASFQGLAAQAQHLDQAAAGIELAEPYPYPLTGRLFLHFTTAIADDPFIRFTNGLRYIDFTVAAGSRRASFRNGRDAAVFQTGTTAGTIELAAQFTLGSYLLEPAAPAVFRIQLPGGPPRITKAAIVARNAGSLTLDLTGYAPTRTMDRIHLKLTAFPGSALQTTNLAADVRDSFDAWIASGGGGWGGQFTIQLTLRIEGSLSQIQAIDVHASNALGASAPARVTVFEGM